MTDLIVEIYTYLKMRNRQKEDYVIGVQMTAHVVQHYWWMIISVVFIGKGGDNFKERTKVYNAHIGGSLFESAGGVGYMPTKRG